MALSCVTRPENPILPELSSNRGIIDTSAFRQPQKYSKTAIASKSISKHLDRIFRGAARTLQALFRGAAPNPAKFSSGAAAPHPAKPLKRLDLNFKILCSCPQAMPVVVMLEDIKFSFLFKHYVAYVCILTTIDL